MYSVTSFTVQGGSLWEEADQMLYNYSLMYSMTSSSVHREGVCERKLIKCSTTTANVFNGLFLCTRRESVRGSWSNAPWLQPNVFNDLLHCTGRESVKESWSNAPQLQPNVFSDLFHWTGRESVRESWSNAPQLQPNVFNDFFLCT